MYYWKHFIFSNTKLYFFRTYKYFWRLFISIKWIWCWIVSRWKIRLTLFIFMALIRQLNIIAKHRTTISMIVNSFFRFCQMHFLSEFDWEYKTPLLMISRVLSMIWAFPTYSIESPDDFSELFIYQYQEVGNSIAHILDFRSDELVLWCSIN